jgi:hypothetical protein
VVCRVAAAEPAHFASPTVSEVRSDRASGYRAIVTSSRGKSALVIEKLSAGRITEQHTVATVKLGNARVLTKSLGAITLVGWHRGVLEFEAGDYNCRLSTADRIEARCTPPHARVAAEQPPTLRR